MIQRRGGDMEDVKELIGEFKYQWNHNRKDLVEGTLAMLTLLVGLYLFLVLGSMENPQ